MARKINIEFIVQGKVEATVHLATLPIVETKSKRGRKKKLALDPEDYDVSGEVSDKKKSAAADLSSDSVQKGGLDLSPEREAVAKKGRGRPGRKKKEIEEEDVNEFPAPKSKPNRNRGGSKSKRGRPGKKSKDLSPKEDEESLISSNKAGEESPSNMDDNLDIDDEMKLEDDDDDEGMEVEGDEDEDDENFPGMNTLSTKNILRLTKMQQEESANSDKNSVTDISSLNIDVNKLTRRQKTHLKNQGNINIDVEEPLMQLPDKKPRKRKDLYLTEEQQVKKMETANKRKLLNQKLQEEQKKITINKILNEAGRKQKMRKEKEEKDLKGKENHQFRALPEGEVGIKFISKADSCFLVLPEGYDSQLLVNPTY